ncbi:hypothetical protein [Variovorax sp. PBL-E5]|uniref:hypothetical protein n=1 Tax=Variovorax sp. PBL-E5 TaxID=434014 RepID=UPI0013A5A47D|nr:hypothetical protein [Variovorax sp. PBL-E5]
MNSRTPADTGLIHASTQTFLSTNADPTSARPAVTLRITKLEIRWVDGDVAMRFHAHTTDVTPSRRMRPARPGR